MFPFSPSVRQRCEKKQSTTSFLVLFAFVSAGYEVTRIKRTVGGIREVDSGDDCDLGRKIKKNGGDSTGLLLSSNLLPLPPFFVKNRFVCFVCQFVEIV